MKNLKKIDVFLSDKKIDVWNEDMNRWEKCSFEEAGINYEDEIESFLRDKYQELGYDDIEINF
jgi:hypothetical protein